MQRNDIQPGLYFSAEVTVLAQNHPGKRLVRVAFIRACCDLPPTFCKKTMSLLYSTAPTEEGKIS